MYLTKLFVYTNDGNHDDHRSVGGQGQGEGRQARAQHEAGRSFLAAEAIADYVDLNAWQVAEIEKAIGEADAGPFADDSEVAATFSKWSR